MLHFDLALALALALFELNEKNLIADCMVGWLAIDFAVCSRKLLCVRPFVSSHLGFFGRKCFARNTIACKQRTLTFNQIGIFRWFLLLYFFFFFFIFWLFF